VAAVVAVAVWVGNRVDRAEGAASLLPLLELEHLAKGTTAALVLPHLMVERVAVALALLAAIQIPLLLRPVRGAMALRHL
jgi:hypothetical protein